MYNGALEIIAECDYDFDKVFEKGEREQIFLMIISDLSYAQGFSDGIARTKELYTQLSKVVK